MTRGYLQLAQDAEAAILPWERGVAAEAMAGLDLPVQALRHLREAGVPLPFLGELCAAGDLALANVDLFRSGLFQLGGADRRWLLAVREWGRVTDVVALAPHDPNEWACLTGQGGLLGMEWLDRAQAGLCRELRLFATPRAWLRGGGRGICVLDWDATALAHLRSLGAAVTLVVDAGVKPRLQAQLAHGGLPLVAEDRGSGTWREAA